MKRLMKNPYIFLAYATITSLIVGYYSALSDAILYGQNYNSFEIVNFAISNVMNDFLFWLLYAILTAYLFGTGRKSAILHSIAVCFAAISVYFIFVSIFSQKVGTIIELLGGALFLVMTLIGSMAGGLIAHYMKRYPLVLALPLIATIYRLQGANPASWHSNIGLLRNIFLCLIIFSVFGYWLFRLYLVFRPDRRLSRKQVR